MKKQITKEVFIENLKWILKYREMTSAELARKINVSPTTVSMWLTGKSLPRMELLDLIAEALDVDVFDLVYSNEEKKRHFNNVRQAMGLPITTISLNDEYSDEEIKDIEKFAKFLIWKRNN